MDPPNSGFSKFYGVDYATVNGDLFLDPLTGLGGANKWICFPSDITHFEVFVKYMILPLCLGICNYNVRNSCGLYLTRRGGC